VSTSFVHGFPSLAHMVGQFPSHVSLPSTTPFPQLAEQLLSFVALQPGAQQPSPFAQVVIGGYVHTTLHAPDVPVRVLVVHEFPSSQVAGQFPSQVSPDSTTPFPHTGAQFASFVWLQPEGQHESPPTHIVIAG
jgi:hypothetical protein